MLPRPRRTNPAPSIRYRETCPENSPSSVESLQFRKRLREVLGDTDARLVWTPGASPRFRHIDRGKICQTGDAEPRLGRRKLLHWCTDVVCLPDGLFQIHPSPRFTLTRFDAYWRGLHLSKAVARVFLGACSWDLLRGANSKLAGLA